MIESRLHARDCFYKYASAATALRVIESKSFRWSSPVRFNDPFDTQIGFAWSGDLDTFTNELNESVRRVIFTDVPVTVGASELFTNMLLNMRRIRHRIPADEILRAVQEASAESAQNVESGIEALNAALQQQFLHSRVLCLTEVNNNVVMWSHYADEHRGVVFRLKCLDAIDHRLLAARQVKYTSAFVPFPGAREYAMHLTGEEPIDFVSLTWQIAFAKHSDWSYEREWRLHIPLLNQAAGDGYSIYNEPPELFDSIYLGCRMEEPQASAIIEAVAKHLPQTKLFRAVRSTKTFDLAFQPLPPGPPHAKPPSH